MFSIGFVALLWTVCGVDAQNCRDDIEEIREMLARQNTRIERLETENERMKLENERLGAENKRMALANKQFEDHIKRLELKNTRFADQTKQLELENKHLKREYELVKGEISELRDTVSQQIGSNSKVHKEQNTTTKHAERRLLLPQTDGSITPVAFYAFMSKDEAPPSAHFTLKFDVVKTNVGNGYNSHSGTFMAPVAGTYVFTYTIFSSVRGAIWLNILVNEEVFGGSVSDTQENGDYDSETTTIVANLKQGDSVNIRTTQSSTTSIRSGSDLHTTFAGWRIF